MNEKVDVFHAITKIIFYKYFVFPENQKFCGSLLFKYSDTDKNFIANLSYNISNILKMVFCGS